MSQVKLKSGHSPLLPQSFRLFLHRRFSEIIGFIILLMVSLCATALATWNIHDPSFNHATSSPVQNWLGFGGASVSDLLIQIFGLASIVFLLPPLAWSVRFFSHQEFNKPLRMMVSWILGSLLASGAISTISAVGNWPLPSGLGGLTGDLLLSLVKWLPALALGENIAVFISGTLLTIAAFFTILNASRMQVNDVATPFGALSHTGAEIVFHIIGQITHTFLSIAAFFRRLPNLLRRREKNSIEAARALHNPHHHLNSKGRLKSHDTDVSAMSAFGRFRNSLKKNTKGFFSKAAIISKSERVEPHFEFSQQRAPVEFSPDAGRDEYSRDNLPDTGASSRVTAANQSVKQGKRVAREGQPMLKLVKSNVFELPPVNLITIPKKASQI